MLTSNAGFLFSVSVLVLVQCARLSWPRQTIGRQTVTVYTLYSHFVSRPDVVGLNVALVFCVAFVLCVFFS